MRDVCAPENGFVDLHLRHRAKQQGDIAVLDGVWTLREREDATRELLRVEHARILLGARVVFERRFGGEQELHERAFVAELATALALLVLDKTQLTELVHVLVLTRRHVERHLEQTREEMIEERNQRRLAAEVQLQRVLFANP